MYASTTREIEYRQSHNLTHLMGVNSSCILREPHTLAMYCFYLIPIIVNLSACFPINESSSVHFSMHILKYNFKFSNSIPSDRAVSLETPLMGCIDDFEVRFGRYPFEITTLFCQ